MNLKKYLQLRAEKDAEALLTDEDLQFIEELAQQVNQKEAEPKRKRIFRVKSLKKCGITQKSG